MRGLGQEHAAEASRRIFKREKDGPRVHARAGRNPYPKKSGAIILDRNNAGMTDECEALLYAASRVQVLNDVIKPALQEGKLVVCDRYVDSSLAYQGIARGLGLEFVESINSYAMKNFMPDATVFLDIDPVSAFKRKHGADKNDRIERRGSPFTRRYIRDIKSSKRGIPKDLFPWIVRGINILRIKR